MGKRFIILTTIFTLILTVFLSIGFSNAWFTNSSKADTNLTASIQRSYFESGTGTAADPYEIRRPIQLYYFSWLQQMGYFNQEDSNNSGNIKQTYFYLSSDIDMNGFTIPSIGTASYPFVGNFDGRGHIISNLYIQNNPEDFTNEPKAANYGDDKDQIVGFFGVVGTLDESDGIKVNGYTYSKQVNQIKDFCLDTVVITSETPKDNKTLIGIVAGYVNGSISGVAVCNSGIFVASGISPLGNTLYTKLSDYTTIGYCKDEYKGQFQIVEVALSNILIEDTGSGSSGSGILGPGGEPIDDVPGNAWGGSINMKNLYSRLYDIYTNRADSTNAYYESETRYQYIDAPELNSVDDRTGGGNVNGGISGTGIGGTGSILDTNKFRVFDQNYDEGAATFSRSLFDNGESFIYLMGEIDENFDMQDGKSQFINKIITVHTLERQTATGMYIYSGSNYLSLEVNNGSPTLTNKTSKSEATIWFTVTGSSGQYIFTQISGQNYYLGITIPSIGLPSLRAVDSSSDISNWSISGNIISIYAKNIRRTLFSTGVNITFFLRYQSDNWTLVEEESKTLFITDGTNYLTYSVSGSTLSVANTTNSSNSASWINDITTDTIYTNYNDNRYYLINNDGVLQIVLESNITSSMKKTWTTGSSNDQNYIKNRIGNVDYAIEYHSGWTLWPSSYYKIHYGAYYLRATNEGLSKTEDTSVATNWIFSDGTSGGEISTTLNSTKKYLAVTTVSGSVKLTLSTSVKTNWATEAITQFTNASVYSLTTTYDTIKYYLICENGTWSVVKESDNRYVVGYKYSFYADGSRSAIWLGHNMSTSSGSNFTTASSVETAPIFYWDSSGYLYVKNGSTKMYLGVYLSGIYSVVTQTSTRYWMVVSINSNSEITCKYKSYTHQLNCNGSRYGYNSSYDYPAYLVRPPMSLDYVSGQNINFIQNDGSMSVEQIESSYFKEVEGSPETTAHNSVSKLHSTYIPISVIDPTSDDYVAMLDGSTSYIVSQRNTGYIVSGSEYQKYDSYSTYRLGDIRVANYNLDELNAEYFDSSTKEILKVLTSNALGADQEYSKDTASSYFNTAFPKIQETLQSDGNMYGIHFMNAQISASRTTFAEKAVIEHTSYYNYEFPESSIDFNLMNAGYLNFFAGTYANDAIVGDNNAFFSLHQVFRYSNLLNDGAIVAIYTSSGKPNVLKLNNDKYYYYDSTNGTLQYIRNIDNIFSTGKSLDELYLQATSGVYMDKTNTSNTLYYTLRNDVRNNYYYTYNQATGVFTEHYSTNLGSNYVLSTGITGIKQIKKVYTRYTSAGASSLATKEIIYYYSDGTYSKDGVVLNVDNSITYNSTKYSLAFDLAWIDTATTLISDAIYYFEIPVLKGEYCLGSVADGRGAYLLYLDLSTNASSNTGDGETITSECAIVETKTTKIETYVYPKGISIVENTTDFLSVPDYETIGIALQNPDNYTISRDGDNIVITANSGEIVYIGYGLSANGTPFSSIITNTPYKTTIITEEITMLKKVNASGEQEIDSYSKSTVSVLLNEKVNLEYDSILMISSLCALDSTVNTSEIDTPVIDISMTLNTNNSFEITSITATVVNKTDKNVDVKLEQLTANPSYTYKVINDDDTTTTTTVNYTINISPSTLDSVGDEANIAPSS